MYDAQPIEKLDARDNVLFNYTIVIDGKVVGTWKRTFKKGAVFIEFTPFAPFTLAEMDAFNVAVHRYGEFLGMAVILL